MKSNHKILIVDDLPLNVEIIHNFLTDNYVLADANSGQEALEILPLFKPDLVLLDIKMPGIDGYEVCRRIRQEERYSFIKIIMVSALSNEHERLKGYEVGADDYVTKPFVEEELQAKVRVFLRLKRAEEIDRLKTDILHLFSHETRTPLNAIIGLTSLLRQDNSLSEDTRSTIGMIEESGLQLHKFIEKTMFLCELKSTPSMRSSSESLISCLSDVIKTFKESASLKNLSFKLEVDKDCYLKADWEMLHKAFDYVIDNAVKYSPEGGTIRIRQETSKQSIIIKISDQGEGIPHDWIDKIFDEFAVRDIIHHQQGQGLSLAISKYVLELHGGFISVENTSDKGTTFAISFPLTLSENK